MGVAGSNPVAPTINNTGVMYLLHNPLFCDGENRVDALQTGNFFEKRKNMRENDKYGEYF